MRKTFVYRNGELVEKGSVEDTDSKLIVMPDIQPYQSMVTGELITSRSRHREHLKQHGMIEVGNDSSLTKKYEGMPDTNPAQRREILRHQVNQFTNAQWEKMGRKHRQAVIDYMNRNGKD